MIMKQLLYIILCAFELLTSCRKEQPSMNENNNCGCAKEVSADFVIEEMTHYNLNTEMRTETDTAYNSRNIRFVPFEKNAEYKWYIGSEILSDSVIVRYFSDAFAGQNIPITLVVKKPPNTICFPNDDGVDTITKYVYIHPWNGSFMQLPITPTLMEGTFRVAKNSGGDSTDITIDYYYIHSQTLGHGVKIINLNGTNDTINSYEYPYTRNYREFRMLFLLNGSFKYKINREAEFKFYDETVTPNKYYHLKGRKL